MQDLIKRIEAADGPSRELDWLIAEAFGEVPEHSIQEVGFHYGWWRKSGEFSLRRAMDSSGRTIESWRPKPRTSSIDAAMTLVLDGFILQLSEWDHEDLRTKGPWQAILTQAGKRDSDLWGYRCDHAKTPALALCAAALRARNG